jgi:hypothetical protein
MCAKKKLNIDLVDDAESAKKKAKKSPDKRKTRKKDKALLKKIKKAEKKLRKTADALVLNRNEITQILRKIIRLRKNIADGKKANLPRIKMRRLRARLKITRIQLKEVRALQLEFKNKVIKRKKKIRELKSGK